MNRHQTRFTARALTDVEAFIAQCAACLPDTGSPFQAAPWLRAWYGTLGRDLPGWRPVLVVVREAASGAVVLGLPLAGRRSLGLSVLGFADATVVDYNGPLMPPGRAFSPREAQALWLAVRQALKGHDVLLLDKMLGRLLDEAGGCPNPLAQALPLHDGPMFGNQFRLAMPWDAWRHTLDKRVRKEFERSWRVFTRHPQARFERVVDPARARVLMNLLDRHQARRMREAGQHYVLDQPAYQAFYAAVLEQGLASGQALLTCLRAGDEVVAVLFGVGNGHRYIALRQVVVDEAWKACSPGRLLLLHTIEHLCRQGLTYFDFGIGAYFHKDAFNVQRIPLFDTCVALSWRGRLWVQAWRARRWLRQRHWAVSMWRHARALWRARP